MQLLVAMTEHDEQFRPTPDWDELTNGLDAPEPPTRRWSERQRPPQKRRRR